MSFDLKLLGDKLKRCRTNLQLELGEVSSRIGFQIDHYRILEEGKIMPSGDEILILADFYKQDYQYFISNQLETASEKVQVLYRKFGEQFSKADRWTIQEFIYLCECEQLAFNLTDFRSIPFAFKPIGTYFKGHGVAAAEELRKKLSFRPDTLVKDIYYEFRKLGIHIFRRKLVNSDISGLFIMHPWAGKCILVNYDEDIYRQNFTVAHEVAHSIFDNDQEVNVSYFADLKGSNLVEVRANTFASKFLVPPGALDKYKSVQLTEDQILNLATQLKVNVTPLLIALVDQGLLSSRQKTAFDHLKVSKVDKIDAELEGLSPKTYAFKTKLLERGLSSFYVDMAYGIYESGEISSGKLAEMLLVDESELTRILKLYNRELQYGD